MLVKLSTIISLMSLEMNKIKTAYPNYEFRLIKGEYDGYFYYGENRMKIYELPEQSGLVFYDLHIHLEERGEYYATVELVRRVSEQNVSVDEVYSIKTEGLRQLIEDGFMLHGHDKEGLTEYLISIGKIPKNSHIQIATPIKTEAF